MTEGYLTAAGYGEAEYTDRRSRFIGQVQCVHSEEEARAFLDAVRAKHADATHNVWAYTLRDGNILRWSDDGEPGGTAGQPTLNVLRGENVEDVCCVTTRYHGGIMLGSGGLVRAYSAAARLALQTAGVARMMPWRQGTVRCAYSQYDRLCRLLRDRGARVEDSRFGEQVEVLFSVPEAQAEALGDQIRDLTAATAETRFGGVVLRPEPKI